MWRVEYSTQYEWHSTSPEPPADYYHHTEGPFTADAAAERVGELLANPRMFKVRAQQVRA